MQDETPETRAPTCIKDRPVPGARLPGSMADRPTIGARPSVPHQEASEDSQVPMDQSGDDDDLLGEDMVDYEASPQHEGMEVNMITFLADYTIIGDDEPVVAQFDFSPKDMIFTKPKEHVNHLKSLLSIARS